MNIESLNPLAGQPAISYPPKEYRDTVVALVLAAITGLACYLILRQLSLSVEGKNIRASFKNPPKSLSAFDLYWLAKKIESLEVQKMQPSDRYKVAIFGGRLKFIVSKGQDNALHVQYIRKTLGQGGFGKVVKLIDLHSGAKTALKVAEIPKEFKHGELPTEYKEFKGREEEIKLAYLEAAVEDLKKEHNNLMLVHESGIKPVGVQDKPLTPILTITKLYESSSQVRLAFEGPIYKKSLDQLDVVKLRVKTRLDIALQVLEGMKTLYKNKLINHDLKPHNVLFRRDEQDALIVHIGDLGGVTREGDLHKELDKGLAHTPAFASSKRLELATKVPIRFLKKKLVKESEKFTIGVTICWILTGHLLEDLDSLDEVWKQAGLSSDTYKDLLKDLKKVFEGGFKAMFIWDNVKTLRHEVRRVLEKANKALR